MWGLTRTDAGAKRVSEGLPSILPQASTSTPYPQMSNLIILFMRWLCLLSSIYNAKHIAHGSTMGESTRFYDFKVQTKRDTKLCNSKDIVTINGEYWLQDLQQIEKATLASGGPPPKADAYTINGHPGPNYNCSTNGI
ncbi:Laccase-6 protein [Vigna angularis]|uniref:Laccase-6 protein n=1 Tax=Phaseolus angularis TaxID=3914 RepID=A0A8T0JPL3_PHAAN|nr:Laccase-6 protein [Vigna angularis]